MSDSLKQTVFGGTMWMAGISLCQQALQFVVQIVLARLLVPHDYGVAAVVMTLCSFASIFATAGVGTALIQRKNLSREVVDATAIITGALAILLGGGIFIASGPLAEMYKMPETSFLFKLAAVDVFLKVMISLYDALLLRDLQYRSLSLRTFTAMLTQAVVSISMAKLGYGPVCLVVGYLSYSATMLLLGMLATRYVPRTLGDWSSVKGIFQFGSWILLGRLANQGGMTLDQLIIARILDAASIGLMNVAKTLSSLLPNTVIGFVARVTLPVFSRWQDDMPRMEHAYWRGVRLNMLVAFPLCGLMGVLAEPALALLYGSKWLAAVPLIRIFAVQAAVVAIDGGLTGSVINASGKPKYGTLVMVLSLFFLPSAVLGGSPWGLYGVAWGLTIFSVLVLLINQVILHRLFDFRVWGLLNSVLKAVMALFPMILVGRGLMQLGLFSHINPPVALSKPWFLLAAQSLGISVVCLLVYAFFAYALMKEDLKFLFYGVKGVIRK